MTKIAFFDTKPYDKYWFDIKNQEKYKIVYHESKLNSQTAQLAKGCEVVCAFVNDDIDKEAIDVLTELGVKLLAMRCAGFSNVDIKYAYNKLCIVRVPAYSPYAVAEAAIAMLQTLNRKLHRAYIRTRDFNFSLAGLTGIDLHGKTMGVIGTGKIGRVLIDIARGYGMKILAYDLFPAKDADFDYVDLETLFKESDVISLHCPLTDQTYHILDENAFKIIKEGAYIVNTSRGALVDSVALLNALNSERIRGAALDVYEEEGDLFFEDFSGTIVKDDILSLLISRPNVLLTSHQAYLTEEALSNIAETTIKNIDEFFLDGYLENEICYHCDKGKVKEGCRKNRKERCFKQK